MTYAESYIQINNTWHLLLTVKTSEPTTFGSLISFELGDYTCIYSVNTPIRTFVEDNKYTKQCWIIRIAIVIPRLGTLSVYGLT